MIGVQEQVKKLAFPSTEGGEAGGLRLPQPDMTHSAVRRVQLWHLLPCGSVTANTFSGKGIVQKPKQRSPESTSVLAASAPRLDSVSQSESLTPSEVSLKKGARGQMVPLERRRACGHGS